MTVTVTLEVQTDDGTEPLKLDIGRTYCLGFTIKDTAKMDRHMDEVEKIGVRRPHTDQPPMIFPMASWSTVFGSEAEVQYRRTNGEVEIVTIDDGGELYVTVGSDHTDRKLEMVSIPWSKQVAPNVVAPVVWRWDDVKDHWDQVTMECWISDGEGGERRLYQRAGVDEFWSPLEMREGIRGRVAEDKGALLFLSGTVVTVDQKFHYDKEWTLIMHDPVLDRTIEHTYQVVVLADEISGTPGVDDMSGLDDLTGRHHV
ncbi:MAG TPA: DUF2848 family protein [Actinomycetales bacterium]|nr:DUF2848 family protein [Actinomycetales bacterium]